MPNATESCQDAQEGSFTDGERIIIRLLERIANNLDASKAGRPKGSKGGNGRINALYSEANLALIKRFVSMKMDMGEMQFSSKSLCSYLKNKGIVIPGGGHSPLAAGEVERLWH